MVLLYDEPFWDNDRDMFGLLNEAERADSLDPKHYEQRRGRFYLIWNATKTSGRPVLIALMAGHAAHQAEVTDSTTLMNEITERLRKVFSPSVPAPREVIVTRWKQDPFTRGTYSFVAPRTQPQDYDLMAKSVGNLHFAGEATCGTHPATVHGAFLSGLRVAADVMNAMVGPISLPSPLVGVPTIKQELSASAYTAPLPAKMPSAATATPARIVTPTPLAGSSSRKPSEPLIKQELDSIALSTIPTSDSRPMSTAPRKSVCSSDQSFWAATSSFDADVYETCILSTIACAIGEKPLKPQRPGVNPFLLYTRAKWDACRDYCAADPVLKDAKNAIRTTLGQWWKALSEKEKEPYQVESREKQREADELKREWEVKAAEWEKEASRIRVEYIRENPPPEGSGIGVSEGNKRSRM